MSSTIYDGRTIAITGGTGSFGSTMARRLLSTGCREIRVFSRDEAKQDAMRHAMPDKRIRFLIGDVRDLQRVTELARGADVIFHAAALKQVPSCEMFPEEAFRTNVLGSENVLRAAVKTGVSKVVCLSTDKAVQPINAMGMTKALMEKLVMSQAAKLGDTPSTTICCVRYGNVLSSRGSVVPLFLAKALAGEALPITVPHMTRFLLSLDEAIGMVDFAVEKGRPGELIVRLAEAATVQGIAEAVLRLTGSAGGHHIVGRRPGEKIHEMLATTDELEHATIDGHYLRVDTTRPKAAIDLPTPWGTRIRSDYTSDTTKVLDAQEVFERLGAVAEIRAALTSRG